MFDQSRVLRFWGTYYVITGLWPVVHLPSFEAVTGPKTDDWLVHMVGLLAAAIGSTILRGAARPGDDLVFLAIISAFAFTVIDLWYVISGVISPVYVADAALEILLIVWLVLSRRRSSGAPSDA